jgi:hypothetical protein
MIYNTKGVFSFLVMLHVLILCSACKKGGNTSVSNSGTDSLQVFPPPKDPVVSSTIGFFLDTWTPKRFEKPTTQPKKVSGNVQQTITLNPSVVLTKIPLGISGTNVNTWMGQVVTEPTLMGYIKNLKPNLIRFPGGSISDVYFWNGDPDKVPAGAPSHFVKADGTKDTAIFWYGNRTDAWTLSVANYYQLLAETHSEGIHIINYGFARYGVGENPVADAAHLAAEWVRYDAGRTQYWEIGNENFGSWEAGYRIDLQTNKDGQPEFADGALYGKHFQVFADSMHAAAASIGHRIYIGAVLYDAPPPSWATPTEKNWNEGLLREIGERADFYSVHHYYTPHQTNSTANEILESGTRGTAEVMHYVKGLLNRMGRTAKPVALTEWNIFAVGQMQMVSHINGLHAVLVVGESLKNQYGITNRWDLANGWEQGNDHAMFSQGDEPGVPKWNPRPAFYQLYFMQRMMGDRLIQSVSSTPDLKTYASSFSSGEWGLSIVNISDKSYVVEVVIREAPKAQSYLWYELQGGTGASGFSRTVLINGSSQTQAGGPVNYYQIPAYEADAANGVLLTVPAKSALHVVIFPKK